MTNDTDYWVPANASDLLDEAARRFSAPSDIEDLVEVLEHWSNALRRISRVELADAVAAGLDLRGLLTLEIKYEEFDLPHWVVGEEIDAWATARAAQEVEEWSSRLHNVLSTAITEAAEAVRVAELEWWQHSDEEEGHQEIWWLYALLQAADTIQRALRCSLELPWRVRALEVLESELRRAPYVARAGRLSGVELVLRRAGFGEEWTAEALRTVHSSSARPEFNLGLAGVVGGEVLHMARTLLERGVPSLHDPGLPSSVSWEGRLLSTFRFPVEDGEKASLRGWVRENLAATILG